MTSIAAVVLLFTAPASASTYTEEEFRCAVGGQRFTAVVQMSMTSFGQRPDGQAYHTGAAPPLECPDNGLVYYKDKFTKAEVQRLTPIVSSPEYQTLRKTETAEYRIYWLMRRMGESQTELLSALLAASWSSDQDMPRKARYQREYVAAITAMPADAPQSFWLQLRAANALRELGQHGASDALIDKLHPVAAKVSDVEERQAAEELLAGLKTLNGEENAASEPVTLIPEMVAAGICARPGRTLTRSETAVCARPDILQLIEQANEQLKAEQ
jgi:hypothetical protein